MKNLICIHFLFLVIIASSGFKNADRVSYYEALAGQSEDKVDSEISKLDNAGETSLNNAYLGAMLMKKAVFLKGPAIKIKTFKKGAGMLEEEIKRNPDNTEYRFLRLSVQEHAPKILKYYRQLEEDRQAVVNGYGKLEPDLKKIIKNYSVSSGVIKSSDLK